MTGILANIFRKLIRLLIVRLLGIQMASLGVLLLLGSRSKEVPRKPCRCSIRPFWELIRLKLTGPGLKVKKKRKEILRGKEILK